MRKLGVVRFAYQILLSFGIDARKALLAVRGLPRFICDWVNLRRAYKGVMDFQLCLHDRFSPSGSTKNEYFTQDLLVAKKIFRDNPQRHLDIGSRLDGFVGHLLSFREVWVADIRPLEDEIAGLIPATLDLMDGEQVASFRKKFGTFESISCLHSIEHFGLGRYGDAIVFDGHIVGLKNLSGLLESRGVFYLSFPVGRPRIVFNAHRIIDLTVIKETLSESGIKIQRITLISPSGEIVKDTKMSDSLLAWICGRDYLLAILICKKVSIDDTD